jgi:hypothetical protein
MPTPATQLGFCPSLRPPGTKISTSQYFYPCLLKLRSLMSNAANISSPKLFAHDCHPYGIGRFGPLGCLPTHAMQMAFYPRSKSRNKLDPSKHKPFRDFWSLSGLSPERTLLSSPSACLLNLRSLPGAIPNQIFLPPKNWLCCLSKQTRCLSSKSAEPACRPSGTNISDRFRRQSRQHKQQSGAP